MKILVIGETCTDKFVYCETNRLSPEAPVPVLQPLSIVSNKGMSGNVVANIKSLWKARIKHLHQKENITKTRYVDEKSNHLFLRFDEEPYKVKNIVFQNRTITEIEKYDIVIVSDYNKGFLTEENLLEIGKRAKLSILDTKRVIKDKSIISAFTFTKLNFQEYKNQGLLKNLDKKILITCGKNGTKWNNKMYESPNPKETIDVSGAGDTFTAAFITKYFKVFEIYKTKKVKLPRPEFTIEQCIYYANYMASIVVSKRGVTTPK